MTQVPCAEQLRERFVLKDLQCFHDRAEYRTFDEYREALLNAWKTFDGTPPEPAGHLFCSARDAEAAKQLFLSIRNGEAAPEGGAVPLEHGNGREAVFFRRFISHYHIWDIAILDAVRTGDAGFLAEGAERMLHFRYRARLLHRLRPGDRFFLVFGAPRSGLQVSDHAAFERDVLTACGCGRPDIARGFFRRDMGLSTLESSSAAVNLCFAAMHGGAALWEEALRLSAPQLKKRKGKFFQAQAALFAGVTEGDADAVSRALAVLAAASPLQQWGYPRDKIVNICQHGLCAFAREHLPPDVFSRVSVPESEGWWPELFAQTAPAAARPPAASRYVFGGELSFLDEAAAENVSGNADHETG